MAKNFLLALSLILLITLTCCPPTQAAEDTLKVGIVIPLTGEHAKFGEIQKNSFVMALEEINAAGGVKGKKIELLIEDDTGKPDVGRSATEKLISQDKIVILGGGYSSSVTFALANVAQQQKMPFLICSGSADRITEQGWNYVFRINPTSSEYPGALSSFFKEVGIPKTAAILFENTLFGQESVKNFTEDCKRQDIQIVVKEGYESGAVDFKPLLIKVKAANPEMLYMISYIMDASLLMRQAKELNLQPKLFIGAAAGFTLPEFYKNAGDATEHVFSGTLWTESVPYPGAKEYFNKYKARFKTDTEYHGAEGYAGMYVLADALKRAKDLSPDAVRDALAATDMMTAFGPVKFISYGKKSQQNKLPTYLVQWQKGKLETVWPKELATKPFVYPTPPWSERK